LGYSVSDLHNDMAPDEITQIFNQQILGKTLQFETSHKCKDGTYIPVELSSTLISLGNRFVIQTFIRDISLRRKLEQEREGLILDLQKALDEIKTLKGILPFCSFCNKIRDDKGHWEQADVYIHKNTDVDITHGVCPDCMKQHYPEEFKAIKQENQE